MTADEPDVKAVVLAVVDELLNGHDLEAVGRWYHPDFVQHAHGAPRGRDGVREFFKRMLRTFPDQSFGVQDVVVDGDKVVLRSTLQATDEGGFLGRPPTSKKIQIQVVDIFRVADGRIIEHWDAPDRLGLLEQLGVIEPPSLGS